MVRNSCAVDGCLNRQQPDTNLSFFSLPRNEERRMKWLKAINRPDLKTKTKVKNYLVCSQHFDKSMIKYIPQLKPDAVPTIALPNEPSTLVESVMSEPISGTEEDDNETTQATSMDLSSEIPTSSRKRKPRGDLMKKYKKQKSIKEDHRKNSVSLLVTMETLKSV